MNKLLIKEADIRIVQIAFNHKSLSSTKYEENHLIDIPKLTICANWRCQLSQI